MENKHILAISTLMLLTVLTSYLIYDNSIKSNLIDQQRIELENARNQINIITGQLSNSLEHIDYLNSTLTEKESKISNLTKEVTNYRQEIQEKNNVLISATKEITKLQEETKYKDQQLNQLINSLQTVQNNKIIQETYKGTLVLYKNEIVYAKMKPLFSQIADDQEDYSKLGIPFFYFKDETILTNEEKQILGEYYTLYDYIIIYNGTENVNVIYHEIGHIIYKNFFANNPSNLEIWQYDYNLLKENNLLSSNYAYSNEQEGFAEEYAYYKTNSNPNQPIEIKQTIFEPIDAYLRN
ncbi:MAG: hypothetical protein PHF86_03775 [Candidatus Nanoarchaeia archaeon]|nr:hypothetical protein [Candidatus Nanoarchaeia archaeon]